MKADNLGHVWYFVMKDGEVIGYAKGYKQAYFIAEAKGGYVKGLYEAEYKEWKKNLK